MLNNRYAVLLRIVASQETLRLFASHLRQAGIIDDAIVSNPTYHDMVESFTATLHILKTIDDIEEHCQNLIDALTELGSTGATECANEFRSEWKAAAEKHGYSNFLDDNGKPVKWVADRSGTAKLGSIVLIFLFQLRNLAGGVGVHYCTNI